MRVLATFVVNSPEDYAPLTEAGHEVVLARPAGPQATAPITADELADLCRDVDALISGLAPRKIIESSDRLLAVVVPAIGHERVDSRAATERGVLVCNSPTPENFRSVSESSVALMVMLLKRLKRKENTIRGGSWGSVGDRGDLLWGKTIGIVGLGRTGSGVARRLAGWDANLIAYDPYLPDERFKELGVTRVHDLYELLRESDLVTVHVVITPETTHMIGEEELRTMKPTAYLVNTSRGQALDEAAVYRALNESWIAGAALDVFEVEPLPLDSPLRNLDPERVYLTPHSVAHTMASLHANRAMAVESTVKLLRGEVPETVVNPDVIPAWQARMERALGR